MRAKSRLQPDLLSSDDFPVEFGRYTLTGLLGEGAMARVFRAELRGPSGFRKPAAVKVIRASVAARSERLRRSLINEARLGGLLHHPNIVETYEFGEEDALPFIAMELMVGLGLDEVLRLEPRLSPAILLEIGQQLCAGLDHAHALEEDGQSVHLVHRDLKPSNIFVSREGVSKIMDFGIAKATTHYYNTTEDGMTKGTPAYMSPEQVSARPIDHRSDIFALGTLLYQMATGKRLFHEDTTLAILMSVAHVDDKLRNDPVLVEVDRAVPGLGSVVGQCLEKNPTDRFDDATAVEQALAELARNHHKDQPLKLWARGLMERKDELAAAGTPLEGDSSDDLLPHSGPQLNLATITQMTQDAFLKPDNPAPREDGEGLTEELVPQPDPAPRRKRPPSRGNIAILSQNALQTAERVEPTAPAEVPLLSQREPPPQLPPAARETASNPVLSPRVTPPPDPPTALDQLRVAMSELPLWAPAAIVLVAVVALFAVASALLPAPQPPPPRTEDLVQEAIAPSEELAPAPAASAPAESAAAPAGPVDSGSKLQVQGAKAVVTSPGIHFTTVRFEAKVKGARNPDVQLHLRTEDSRWTSRPMKSWRKSAWYVIVRFPSSAYGRVVWYVTAADPRDPSVVGGWGTDERPESIWVE